MTERCKGCRSPTRLPVPPRKSCEHCLEKARRFSRDGRARQIRRAREELLLATKLCECGERIASANEMACARCIFLDGHQNANPGGGRWTGSLVQTLIIEALRHNGETTLRDLSALIGRDDRQVLARLHELERHGRVSAFVLESGELKHGCNTKLWHLTDGHERYRATSKPAPMTPGRSWVVASVSRLGFSKASNH